MADLTITPANGTRETALVAAIVAALAAGTLTYALTRSETVGRPALADWEVSAFDGLTPEDQAIHSALGPAIEEAIMEYNMTGEWPTPEVLGEMLIPPFDRDMFWQANGQVQWDLVRPGATDQGTILYHGHGGTAPGQSAYLALIRHLHRYTGYANQLEAWVHPDAGAPAPAALNPETLIASGWRRVVAWSGDNEMARNRGE